MKIYKVVEPALYTQLMGLLAKQQGSGEAIGVNTVEPTQVNTQHTVEPIGINTTESIGVNTDKPIADKPINAATPTANEETLAQVGAGDSEPANVHQCLSVPEQQWTSFEEFSKAK